MDTPGSGRWRARLPHRCWALYPRAQQADSEPMGLSLHPFSCRETTLSSDNCLFLPLTPDTELCVCPRAATAARSSSPLLCLLVCRVALVHLKTISQHETMVCLLPHLVPLHSSSFEGLLKTIYLHSGRNLSKTLQKANAIVPSRRKRQILLHLGSV